jgi:hypothetical protein
MRHELGTADPRSVTVLDPVEAADTAEYIGNMCEELSNLSARSGLRLLHYLLEVAREEAAAQSSISAKRN